jgi:glycosyltransferase involved in cell wall biosynthesis
MTNPKVSIIMNCYNGQEYLKLALDSVLGQTYDNWEIIFWDNKSTDYSKEIFFSYKDERFKYYLSDVFDNLYTARNKALTLASGEFITFLDVDDWWDINKIEIQVHEFLRNSQIDICYTNYYNVSSRRKKLMYPFTMPEGYIFRKLLKDNFIGVSTLMIRKTVFGEIIFNGQYHIIGDYDFTLRTSINYFFKYVSKPLLYYRWHGNNESIKKEELKLRELDILYDELKQNELALDFYSDLNFMKQNIEYNRLNFYLNEGKLNISTILNSETSFKMKVKIFVKRILKVYK